MKRVTALAAVPFLTALIASACGGAGSSGFNTDGGTGGSSGFGGSAGSGGSAGIGLTDSGKDGGDTGAMTSTTIYANTDTDLYTLDPKTNTVSPVGSFSGMSGSNYDSTVTDCAVDAEGNVYVNTETVVYKATLPSSPGSSATVSLTGGIKIGGGSTSFYALAFAPKGFLGSGETLIGGDNHGELWAIDTTSGAVKDLGGFGAVPGSSKIFALSGDMVFYTDSTSHATGVATIRKCDSGGRNCDSSDDYLAGINMTALQTAYTSGTPAPTLLGGIYGGSSTSVGSGTGYGDVFGLGAWEGNVYGFTRASSGGNPYLISIDTTTGAGKVLSSSFGFSSGGWSGAGVTTTTTITIPNPPPPPK